MGQRHGRPASKLTGVAECYASPGHGMSQAAKHRRGTAILGGGGRTGLVETSVVRAFFGRVHDRKPETTAPSSATGRPSTARRGSDVIMTGGPFDQPGHRDELSTAASGAGATPVTRNWPASRSLPIYAEYPDPRSQGSPRPSNSSTRANSTQVMVGLLP